MAESKTLLTFFPLLTLTLFLITLATAKPTSYYQSISPSSVGLHEEKLSHLHFFFHDVVTSSKPTAVRVAEAQITKNSSTSFGAVFVVDDPLTVAPEPGSKPVGKAQGIYSYADQEEIGLLMVMSLAFTEGKYNGSTLSMLGRNPILSSVREFPIVGGSGAFRFARGYALAHTHTVNLTTQNAIVEYNVYVFHY